MLHGRATLMTMRMSEGEEPDPGRLAEITAAVAEEGREHLRAARTLIGDAELEPGIRSGLHEVTDRIERMLGRYV